MRKFLKEYQDKNPEKFNKDLFELRANEDVLQAVTECLKSLEILDEIKLVSVTLETDESQFGPIYLTSKDKQAYKPVLPSRLNKIHYKFIVTPSENIEQKPILSDDEEGETMEREYQILPGSYEREGDLFMDKLLDKWYYINEGARYFLIYQIVDNACYSTGNSISLKSLLMPITVQKKPEEGFFIQSEGTNTLYNLPIYYLTLFSKNVNVLLYFMAKYSFNDLIRMKVENPDNIVEERNAKRCPVIIDKLNKFFGIDLKFSDELADLMEEGREVFRTPGEGVYISVDKQALENRDRNLLAILGCFFDVRINGKTSKKKLAFKYNDLITPIFWINALASYFTVNTDPIKRFDKIKTMLVSLDRLCDISTQRILRLPQEDKKNSLAIIRYILRNFDELNGKDPNDFDDKRIRIVESLLFPLRDFISKQIYRILNAPTRSKQVLDRIFSNLSNMFLMKATVQSELIRYYSAANDGIGSVLTILKATLCGPQSLTKTVSNETRDVHPSSVGRLSLVASSASNPGLSSVLSPFCELEPGMYFAPEKGEDKEE